MFGSYMQCNTSLLQDWGSISLGVRVKLLPSIRQVVVGAALVFVHCPLR